MSRRGAPVGRPGRPAPRSPSCTSRSAPAATRSTRAARRSWTPRAASSASRRSSAPRRRRPARRPPRRPPPRPRSRRRHPPRNLRLTLGREPGTTRSMIRPSAAFHLPSVLAAAVLIGTAAPANQASAPSSASPPVIWYDKPAVVFEEALPLGNGRTGVMVFGGPATDRLLLNDSTLWTGG